MAKMRDEIVLLRRSQRDCQILTKHRRQDGDLPHNKNMITINGKTMDDGVDEPEYPPSETPRTDNEICLDSDGNAVMWRGENIVTATFARKLEHETNSGLAAIVDAIMHILSTGGHEEWPIIKRLRAALKI